MCQYSRKEVHSPSVPNRSSRQPGSVISAPSLRMVVQNSARLGEIEIAGGDKEEHGRIMRESLMALAQPI